MNESFDIFREEALRHHRNEYLNEGDLLRISPAWTHWFHWLLIAVTTTAILYSILGTIGEYASGPAVVRAAAKTDITANWAGSVTSIETQSGQKVSAGDILVRFYVEEQAAELERLKREFELQMIEFLKDPSDQTARHSLATLRAEAELAEARLQQRFIRAPHSGVVSDIRIRSGQHLTPGEVILSLIGEKAEFSVIAMLPGHYRPMLRAGMPLRLELVGFRYAYQDFKVETIGDDVVGPNEIRRYLGSEIADTVAIPGPVVLVKASLPSRSFRADGTSFNYFDGMHGRAEARVRTEPILLALVPGLRAVLENAGR